MKIFWTTAAVFVCTGLLWSLGGCRRSTPTPGTTSTGASSQSAPPTRTKGTLQDWTALIRRSGIPDRAPPASPLRAVSAGLAGHREALFKLMEPALDASKGSPSWQLPADGLPDQARQAVSQLVRWHGQGLELSVLPCEDLGATGSMMMLGKLALLSAGDSPRDPQLLAVLHLARSLRRSGRMLGLIGGANLAGYVLDWAAARKVNLPAPKLPQRPRAEEFFEPWIRELVCYYQTAPENEEVARQKRQVLVMAERVSRNRRDLSKVIGLLAHPPANTGGAAAAKDYAGALRAARTFQQILARF